MNFRVFFLYFHIFHRMFSSDHQGVSQGEAGYRFRAAALRAVQSAEMPTETCNGAHSILGSYKKEAG